MDEKQAPRDPRDAAGFNLEQRIALDRLAKALGSGGFLLVLPGGAGDPGKQRSGTIYSEGMGPLGVRIANAMLCQWQLGLAEDDVGMAVQAVRQAKMRADVRGQLAAQAKGGG